MAMAAMFRTMPLAIGFGQSSEFRRPLIVGTPEPGE
jgi:multidrug efflux pump subunit AcrB